uniref:Uncharacterized protein n=1 Tax=Myoviridae sp. ctNQr16 TaxID=2826644 RepID=A0A8S5MAF8_9CAUD|nr:MAG TPA: hypothetical protein [Myoviridae sp. ctNQr16]
MYHIDLTRSIILFSSANTYSATCSTSAHYPSTLFLLTKVM